MTLQKMPGDKTLTQMWLDIITLDLNMSVSYAHKCPTYYTCEAKTPSIMHPHAPLVWLHH